MMYQYGIQVFHRLKGIQDIIIFCCMVTSNDIKYNFTVPDFVVYNDLCNYFFTSAYRIITRIEFFCKNYRDFHGKNYRKHWNRGTQIGPELFMVRTGKFPVMSR